MSNYPDECEQCGRTSDLCRFDDLNTGASRYVCSSCYNWLEILTGGRCKRTLLEKGTKHMNSLCRICGQDRKPGERHICPAPPCKAEDYIESFLDGLKDCEGYVDTRTEGWAMWDWAIENAEEIWAAACKLEPSLKSK